MPEHVWKVILTYIRDGERRGLKDPDHILAITEQQAVRLAKKIIRKGTCGEATSFVIESVEDLGPVDDVDFGGVRSTSYDNGIDSLVVEI